MPDLICVALMAGFFIACLRVGKFLEEVSR